MSRQIAFDHKKALPEFPLVGQQLLVLINSADSNITEIGRLIAKDPALAARIVGAANAAYFLDKPPVYTVEEASVRLGLNRIRMIVLTVLIGKEVVPTQCAAFDLKAFWFKSMQTAFASSKLSAYMPLELPSEAAYLSALLSNIGSLLVSCVYPDVATEAIKADGFRLDAETVKAKIGMTQHEYAAEVLTYWGMPNDVVDIVKHMGVSEYPGKYDRVWSLVNYCDKWSRDDFAEFPELPLTQSLPKQTMSVVACSCQHESKQLQSFAAALTRTA